MYSSPGAAGSCSEGRGGESTPGEALQDLIDQSQYYAFGNRGAGRREKRL
jgi:hypothetical protein